MTSFRRATTSSLSLNRSSSTSGLYSSCNSSRWRFSFEWFTSFNVIALGTMSIISRFTMLKYEWTSNSEKRIGTGRQNRTSGRTDDLGFEGFALVQRGLRTNDRRWLREDTQLMSREKERTSLNTASVACEPFLVFCCWAVAELKELPKKRGGSRSLLSFSCAAVDVPGLSSRVAGLFAFKRSVTIIMAFEEERSAK
jgi:hypothetical protein